MPRMNPGDQGPVLPPGPYSETSPSPRALVGDRAATLTRPGDPDASVRWMARDLVDDHLVHRTADEKEQREREDRALVRGQLIGMMPSPRGVPVLVCCFALGSHYGDHDVCLNEVYNDEAHRGHVSRRSVLGVSGAQLEELHRTGRLRCGGALVCLLPEMDEPQERPAP